MVAVTEPVPLGDLPDADLIARFKRGDDRALEVLLQRHHDDLYRYCFGLVGNSTEAEDVCQESLTRAIARLASLHSSGAFRSWLFRIARNLSMDAFRHHRRFYPLPDENIASLSSSEETAQEQIERGEERTTVAAALGTLKQSHRTVLMLREVEGLSYAEIAHRLELSQSAVETLLFRARRRLREEYLKRDKPVAGLGFLGFLGGLRIHASRLVSSLPGAPLAAKVAFTVVLVGGSTLAIPRLIPPLGSHASSRSAVSPHASRLTSALPGPRPVPVLNPSAFRRPGKASASTPRHRAQRAAAAVPHVVGRASSAGAGSQSSSGAPEPATGTSSGYGVARAGAPVSRPAAVSVRSHSTPPVSKPVQKSRNPNSVHSARASESSVSENHARRTHNAAHVPTVRHGAPPTKAAKASVVATLSVAKPRAVVPTVSVPTVVPKVPLPGAGSVPTVPPPRVSVPTASIPHVSVPTVAVPHGNVPTVSVPHPNVPTLVPHNPVPTLIPTLIPTLVPTLPIQPKVPTVVVKAPKVRIGKQKP